MENIEAMLCAYIEGDLDEAGRAQIEKHLADHPQHRKLLEELVAMRDYVRQLPRAKAPRDIADSMRGTMERSLLLDGAAVSGGVGSTSSVRPSRWPRLFAVAAVFFLIASMGILVLHMLSPMLNSPNLAVNKSSASSASSQPIGPLALANPTTQPSEEQPVLTPSTQPAPALLPAPSGADHSDEVNKELARQTAAFPGGGGGDKDRGQVGSSGNLQLREADDLTLSIHRVDLVVRGSDPVAVSQSVQRYFQSHPELVWFNPIGAADQTKAQQAQSAATEPSAAPPTPMMFHVRNLNPQQLADLQAAMTAITDQASIAPPSPVVDDSVILPTTRAAVGQQFSNHADAENNTRAGGTIVDEPKAADLPGAISGVPAPTAPVITTPLPTTRFDATTQPATTQPTLVDALITIAPLSPTTLPSNAATTQPDAPATRP